MGLLIKVVMKVKISKTLLALSATVYLVSCTTIDKPTETSPSTDIPVQIAIPAKKEATKEPVAIPEPPIVTKAPEPVVKEIEEELAMPTKEDKIPEKEIFEEKMVALVPNPVISLCQEIGTKLGSVSITDCLNQQLTHSSYSAEHRSLAYKDFPPLSGRAPMGRVLVIGGIHGDEFSSVSMIFRWMGKLDQFHSGMFHWRFVPSSNPDGLLKSKSQRQNVNGVDLNRNFPTADWETQAHSFWATDSLKNPRRYPGPSSASEPETQWLVNQIEVFKPDVIISMHAPYHLVDYDGPPKAPENLGSLYLRKLGVFPGSLGNYAGIDLNMPIVTVELQSAGIMPSKGEIDQMWRDLITWLRGQLSTAQSD